MDAPTVTRSAQTILVIDDEPGVREFFTRALELSGIATVQAATAEEALRILSEGVTADAIILDLLMPGIGGLGFLRHLQQERAHRRTPIAIVTGHIAISDEVRAAASDLRVPIHYKPVTLEELLKLTEELLRYPPA